MNRRPRSARRQPRFEPLEPRALLAANDIFVRFAAGAPASTISAELAGVRGTVAQTYPDGPALVAIGAGEATAAAIRTLQGDPFVVYAEADRVIHAESDPVLPDDPGFAQQAGLSSGNDVDIDAPEAWGISTGNPSTIIAVIDTGIDLSNPDFAGRIWTNPVNDAATGYPSDLHGWNFVGGNNDVADDNGHGTHVSGIIAAAGNDGYGVAGVDWQAQIMPLKFLDSQGNGDTSDAVSAIYFAVSHGARVINASWGGVDFSQALDDAIAFAGAHNVVFVTAASNDGTNNDLVTSYPASFRQSNEISVATVDSSGNLAGFSNYGASTVDLAAPGVDILSDYPAEFSAYRLQTLSGTSMSTAFVSGVVALVAGVDPQFTAAELVNRVETTVKPLPGLTRKVITGGIVDAYNALLPDAARIADGIAPAGIPAPTPGGSTDVAVRSTILASDEFLAVHGGTAAGFVVGVYEDVLGRYPDPAGLSAWVAEFQSGTTSRYQIAGAILGSFEGRATEVARWYQEDLGRTTDLGVLKADPGVQGWAGILVAGIGDDAVQDAILASPEYLIGHGGTPPTVIAAIFNDLNDRAPSPFEQASWAGLLYAGDAPEAVFSFFQGAPETHQTKVARWFVSDLGRAESVADLKADPGVQAFASLLVNE